MKKVKIIGAGSIGNHLANASRAMGWSVCLCDIDPAALERTKTDIYPSRYNSWDEEIELCLVKDAPKGGFDFIFIGTPPDSHTSIALQVIEEKPAALLIEKPFCMPSLEGAQPLYERAAELGIKVFTGYDHVVARSVGHLETLVKKGVGEIETIDVSFREHWQGIFNAHPWLDGPSDTYLGFWEKGGGACGEHSHALNLWQHLSHLVGCGRIVEVNANLEYVWEGEAHYDRIALLNVVTESGMLGRIVQDVVTRPSLKWGRIQGTERAIEWHCNAIPGADKVHYIDALTGDAEEETFEKTRPDDFIQELCHIETCLEQGIDSPISIERGLDSMLVIRAAHLSAQEGRPIKIDYSKGYVADALV